MKYHYASLSDQQVRETFFVVPDVKELYEAALGKGGCSYFVKHRAVARSVGGEVLLIGWPDGTTITYHLMCAEDPIHVETVLDTYRASASIYRAAHQD